MIQSEAGEVEPCPRGVQFEYIPEIVSHDIEGLQPLFLTLGGVRIVLELDHDTYHDTHRRQHAYVWAAEILTKMACYGDSTE